MLFSYTGKLVRGKCVRGTENFSPSDQFFSGKMVLGLTFHGNMVPHRKKMVRPGPDRFSVWIVWKYGPIPEYIWNS